MKEYEELANVIQNAIDEYHINASVYIPSRIANAIFVEVYDGDWKHDHLMVRMLVQNLTNPSETKQIVTEEDGSDTFSARYEFYYN